MEPYNSKKAMILDKPDLYTAIAVTVIVIVLTVLLLAILF